MLKSYQPSDAEEVYFQLRGKLAGKYNPEDYVVINPKTKDFFLAQNSVEAMKKARAKYPKGKLFLAQVGRMSGLMK